jgi:hypothetical protein
MQPTDKLLHFFGVKLTERQQCALEQLAVGQTKSDVVRGYLEEQAQRLGLAAAEARDDDGHEPPGPVAA